MGKKFYKSKSSQQKETKENSNVKGKSLPKSKIKISHFRRTQGKQQKEQKETKINIEKFDKIKKETQNDTCIKKKLRPLKFFNIKPEKKAEDMKINELEDFADKFDLNPKINYYLFKNLGKNNQDYKKYIAKYKYTMDFEDALNLGCFDKQYIIKMMNEYNNNISKYKLKINKIQIIDEIKSFSKIKLFNLMFFLISNESSNISMETLENIILSYTIPVSLIFKVPTKFGNTELQYYSYLLFLINSLIPPKSEYNKSKNNDINSSLNKEIYFDFGTKKEPIEQEINMKEFNERKKKLDDYLKGIETKETIKEEKILLTEETIKNNIKNKRSKLKIFSSNIEEIICLNDDKEILNRIKFIYYSILFLKTDDQTLGFLSTCLKIKNYSKEEIQEKESCFNQEL